VFPGHMAGEDLARWYASADVFVFPSTTETLGNVVQEAMASGLPVVVTDKGGPAGVIDPEQNGYVTRARDPQDLADRVETLLLVAALRSKMGANARKTTHPRTWPNIPSLLFAPSEPSPLPRPPATVQPLTPYLT